MIIKADRIITGDGKTVLENTALVLEKGKILELGEIAKLREKHKDKTVLEYPGASILPGLIDMHVHIGYVWNTPEGSAYNDFMIAYYSGDYARQAFAKGVTTMRDVSSPKNLCATMIQAAEKGYIKIPRIIHTDLHICFTGGHAWDHSVEVDGPWQVRAAIRDAIKRGAHWIKIMASHRSDTPEYTQEELNAAVDECHRVKRKIAVHAGTQPSIQMCIDAGFDTIEHGTYLTETQAKQMADKGLVWVPTIVAYTFTHDRIKESMERDNPASVQAGFLEHHEYFQNAANAYRDNFEKLYKTGVKIAAGTDLVYPGREAAPIAEELILMVKYGMPVLEAIKAATMTGAETLGMGERIGEIAPGKVADIAVINGDPLKGVKALKNVREVFYSGESVYKS
ncbi:MAG: amidohydrolase family protein [Treponema sp.]|nr:amidohydrolase family protein [Treponema sp.]